jgi:hypothetical protein
VVSTRSRQRRTNAGFVVLGDELAESGDFFDFHVGEYVRERRPGEGIASAAEGVLAGGHQKVFKCFNVGGRVVVFIGVFLCPLAITRRCRARGPRR